jgi:hypothetical protein
MDSSIVQRLLQASKPLQKIVPLLENIAPSGENLSARCPAHDDHQNSLVVGVGEGECGLVYCHAGCSPEEILDALGFTMRDLFPGPAERTRRSSRPPSPSSAAPPTSTNGTSDGMARPAAAPPTAPAAPSEPANTGLTLERYAQAKKLPVDYLQDQGVSTISYLGKPALRFEYRDPQGEVVSVRFRLALEGDAQFRYRKGDQPMPYGLEQLEEARRQGFIVLGEGESDAHTLWLFEIPALTIPGANTWKDTWADYLEGIARIYVVIEPDKGGATLLKHLAKSRLHDRVHLLDLAETVQAKDPSALSCRNPRRFRHRWRYALTHAIPWADYVRRERDAQQHQLWQQCQALAREPRILRRFGADVAHFVAGETRLPTLLYLALTTRFLHHPVSIVVKGQSSAGKSYVPGQVLRFFPTEAYHVLTSASERVLVYDDEPVAHRFIVLYEADGLKNEFFQYLLRSLLTEGHIRYATVEKTRDGLRTRWIEREGPTGLLTSTTAVSLEPQLETRVWSVTAPDTPAQTKTILAFLGAQAEAGLDDDAADGAVDLTVWRAFQQWLAGAEHRVVIPYATILAKDIPPLAVRLRRDFKRLLSLIRAHALLHQVNRRRDPQGRIIAMVRDYAVVRQLVLDWMAEGLEASGPKAIRDTVEAVKQHCETHPSASVTALAKRLDLDVSTVSRRVQVALQRGYLQNLETGPGRTYQLISGQPLPSERPILPKPRRVWLLSRAAERRRRAASRPSHA